MASEAPPAFDIYKLHAWYSKNRKQVNWISAAVVVVVLIGSITAYSRGKVDAEASEAVSNVALPAAAGGPMAGVGTAEAYLQVAAKYPDSRAAARAILLAAGTYFTDGQFEQARTTFEKFTHTHRDSPFMGEALLGIAGCYDALGRTNEAINAYKDIVDRHPNENIVPQAKFALARLYDAQNNIEQARTLYEEVAKPEGGTSISSEAGIRLEELKIKYPPPAPPATPTPAPEVPATTPPALLLSNLPPATATPPVTNESAPAVPKP
jgi:TolA-binding protein